MKRQCFYFQKGSVVQQVLGADLPVHFGGVGQQPGFGPLPPTRSPSSPFGPGAQTALQCRVPAPSTVLPGHWGWRRQESNIGSSLSLLVSTSHPAFLSTASSANLWCLQTQYQMQKQPLLINFSISSHNCARSKTYNKSMIPYHHSGSAFLIWLPLNHFYSEYTLGYKYSFCAWLSFFEMYDSVKCNRPDLLSLSISFYFTFCLRTGLGICSFAQFPSELLGWGIRSLMHRQRIQKN